MPAAGDMRVINSDLLVFTILPLLNRQLDHLTELNCFNLILRVQCLAIQGEAKAAGLKPNNLDHLAYTYLFRCQRGQDEDNAQGLYV
jgi:hypothetical protein